MFYKKTYAHIIYLIQVKIQIHACNICYELILVNFCEKINKNLIFAKEKFQVLFQALTWNQMLTEHWKSTFTRHWEPMFVQYWLPISIQAIMVLQPMLGQHSEPASLQQYPPPLSPPANPIFFRLYFNQFQRTYRFPKVNIKVTKLGTHGSPIIGN